MLVLSYFLLCNVTVTQALFCGCTEEEAKDPCLPLGYSRAAPAGTVVGSGNFEECRAIAKGLIAGQCQDELCPLGDSMPVELQGEHLATTL